MDPGMPNEPHTPPQSSDRDVAAPSSGGTPSDDQARSLRERAVAVLSALTEAKRTCEEHLARSERRDIMLEVRGRSSFDEAMAAAQEAIERLDRATGESRRPTPAEVNA